MSVDKEVLLLSPEVDECQPLRGGAGVWRINGHVRAVPPQRHHLARQGDD